MAACTTTLTSTYPNHNNVISKTQRKQPKKLKLSIKNMGPSSNALTMESYEEGKLERPKWSGETPISRLVGALISFKPLYSLMKFGARQALISTAEKSNIPWREMTREVLESEVYKEIESVQNPDIVYPDYYLNHFHAYDEGNLSWLAAAEAEPATLSITKRAIPEADSIEETMEIVRGNWIRAIEKHHQQYSGNSNIQDILGIGCSVGFSTKFLVNKFPSANITLHECPARATVNLVKEAFRLLRPGGTITITDNSCKSKILRNCG
ncbi:hypothetical protein RND81_09G089400 [Saponaria officinalis]|uniref:Uncharacterized protein n=1 Tax=Saponaria officinalis TaxID=3572 RepID=A0AAW1IIU0_SAPOF